MVPERGCRLRILRPAGDQQEFGDKFCDALVFVVKGSLVVTVD